MPRTASPLEIAYSAVALVGLSGSLLLLALGIIDLRAVIVSRVNGYRKRYARKLVREAVERAGVCACLLAIGVIAMQTPAAPRQVNRQASVAVGTILLLVCLWKTLHVVWTLVDEYAVRLRLWAEDRAWNKH